MLQGLALRDNGIPIYVQLREQIRAAIGRGVLKPGDQLPTMRQVAVALKIDLNTVQRAYAELEREGVLETVRGRGSFVAQTPPPNIKARRAEARDFAARVAAQAEACGIDLAELVEDLRKLAGRPL
jgi:GntR family transcriptional regulator